MPGLNTEAGRLVPWERRVYVHRQPVPQHLLPPEFHLRPLGNDVSRRLAWSCGFHLVREDVDYSVEAGTARTAA